jgi:hypothetical protein
MSNFVYSKAGASWLGGIGKAVVGMAKHVPGAKAMTEMNTKARNTFIRGTSGKRPTVAQRTAGTARYNDIRNKYVGGAAVAGTVGLGTVGVGSGYMGVRHGTNAVNQFQANFNKANLGDKATFAWQTGALGLPIEAANANLAAAVGKYSFATIGNGIKKLLKKNKSFRGWMDSHYNANFDKVYNAHLESLPAAMKNTDAGFAMARAAAKAFADGRSQITSRVLGAGALAAVPTGLAAGDHALRGENSIPDRIQRGVADKVLGISSASPLQKLLGTDALKYVANNKDHIAIGALGAGAALGGTYLVSKDMPLSARLALAGVGGAAAGTGHAYWPELTKAISDATTKKPDTMLRSPSPQ